jgi:hypothetical protein
MVESALESPEAVLFQKILFLYIAYSLPVEKGPFYKKRALFGMFLFVFYAKNGHRNVEND